MKIILGHWLDTMSYPDALGDEEAVLGTVVTGFKGLVGILETQLGLTSPEVSENRRIAEWQALIRKHDSDNKPFSKSFETDSWNTAKELLRRRDELIMAGWNPYTHSGGSKWLEALAELEKDTPKKLWGFSDRVQALLKKLENETLQLNIESLTIVDEDETLWETWSIKLIDKLKQQGVLVKKKMRHSHHQEMQTDLSVLQRVLSGEHLPEEATGDGSLLLIRSEQEWDAADFLTSWLEKTDSKDTVIIKGEGSLYLDELLHRRGVPAAGVTSPSKWRSVLQILPLTIETYFQPVVVGKIMELLTLPFSPVPGLIRDRLARALATHPGIGGPQWLGAIEEGLRDYEKNWAEDGLDEREIQKRKKNVNDKLELWVTHDYFDTTEGIPFNKLVEICQKVGQWAAAQLQLNKDPLFAQAIHCVDDVIEGIKTLAVTHVTPLQVSRILDAVLGGGTPLPHYEQEAAAWQVVQHPGQIWQPAETILWWGFHKNVSSPHTRTWTSKERLWLKDRGIHLLEQDVERRRDAEAWQQAARLAKKRLILIAPEKVRGEETPLHPFWDEIRYAVANSNGTINKLTYEASELRKHKNSNVFGETFDRALLSSNSKIPNPMRVWRIPENIISRRKEESATSFEGLIGCPLKWTFKYSAKLRPGNSLSLPHEALMLGNLGHVILETLILEKLDWDPEEVRGCAGELFDKLTPMLAAPLLEPQNSIKRNETRMKLQNSMRQFFKVLNKAGIKIRQTELEVLKTWGEGIEFKGRLDLVGETPSGQKIFFDAKWSKKPNNYRERLEKVSVQLTLYNWLLADHVNEELPVAYFMLRSGEFFSLPHAEFPTDYHVQGPSLIETYQVLTKSIDDVWSQISTGTLIAPGVPAMEDDGREIESVGASFVSLIDPPCAYCEYQNLCGYRRITP